MATSPLGIGGSGLQVAHWHGRTGRGARGGPSPTQAKEEEDEEEETTTTPSGASGGDGGGEDEDEGDGTASRRTLSHDKKAKAAPTIAKATEALQ